MYEQPFQELPLSEEEIKKRTFLAHNIVQFVFANIDYRNTHPHDVDIPELERDEIIFRYGEKFKEWYMSDSGKLDILNYIKNHDEQAILEEKDMSILVRSFLSFSNRLSRTGE